MRRDANIPATEATRDRPWQLLLTGEGIAQIDAATRQALESILELFTEVEGLVVHTSAGRLRVTRDFSSDYTTQVDRLLGDIFKNNAAVTGIEFLGLGQIGSKLVDLVQHGQAARHQSGVVVTPKKGG
jgi:hypothetical protein